MLLNQLEPRDRQLLRALLVLGVVALALIVGSQIITAFYFFGDIILVFFLAWLIAFVISPVVSWLIERIPGALPPAAATVLVYIVVVVGLAILVAASAALASSIDQFIREIPNIRQAAGARAAVPGVARDARLHRGRPRAAGQPRAGEPERVRRPARRASAAAWPSPASASSARCSSRSSCRSGWSSTGPRSGPSCSGWFRPRTPRRRVLQTATSRSFGGFLRGQAIMGLSYFFVALTPHLLFGLPLAVLSATTAGVLMAIPFFGQFVSWVPPVLVALVFQPEALLPTALIMGIGWFIAMNVLQPRIMQGAVGIHPIVVLGSVSSVRRSPGSPGVIFGIPIAAVLSALFFHFLNLASTERSVASRAARRLERRGKPVRSA